MRLQKFTTPLTLLSVAVALAGFLQAQSTVHSKRATPVPITLQESSRKIISSETGGAFMFPARCDADGMLYVRKYATDSPLLGPIVKIDLEGKRVASFDPAAVSSLKLDRADAFSPGPDGGLYQIAAAGIIKPQIYVLHFSSDGSPSSPIHLDADFQPYQFAPFAGGNLLVSGYQRDAQNRSNPKLPFTAVFSADGRLMVPIRFDLGKEKFAAKKAAPSGAIGSAQESHLTLDLSDAEPGVDGNIYVLRRSSPALIYVISPAGQILRTLKISSPVNDVMPNAFHVAANRVAVSFWDESSATQTLVVTDAQTGRRIATYFDPGTLGPSFACYSADEEVFTFLHLGEGNTLEVIRAEAR